MALPCFWLFFFIVWNGSRKTDNVQEKKKALIQQQSVPVPLISEPGNNKENEFIKAVYLPGLNR